MTAVMPFVDKFHVFKWQVVTGFTLFFGRENVRLSTMHANKHEGKSKDLHVRIAPIWISLIKKEQQMVTLSISSSRQEMQRLSRFIAVGAVGTVLDFSLLTMLKLAGLPTLLANSLSFTAGLLNNFTWNRLWTFNDGARTDWRKQFAQFSLVSLFGLALNNLIVLSLEGFLGNILGQPEWGYLPAKVIATGVVVFWNYFANRTWTFRKNNVIASNERSRNDI